MRHASGQNIAMLLSRFWLNCLRPAWISNRRAMFNSEEGRAKKCGPPAVELCGFLIWAKLLLLPRMCSHGHEWRFNNNDSSDSSYVHLHCAAKLPEVFDQDSDDEENQRVLREPVSQRPFWKREGGQLVPMVEFEEVVCDRCSKITQAAAYRCDMCNFDCCLGTEIVHKHKQFGSGPIS